VQAQSSKSPVQAILLYLLQAHSVAYVATEVQAGSLVLPTTPKKHCCRLRSQLVGMAEGRLTI